MKKIQWLSMMTAASLGLAACGGGGSGGNPPAASGTLNVALTDNPACGFDHVYVTVKEVRVNQSANAGNNDANWHAVTLKTPKKIDLLSLTNGVLEQIGQTPLPVGHYQQVRLVLEPNVGTKLANSVVPTDGSEVALTTPSAAQSGYKVVGNFEVKADTLTDLVLDFDACRSVVQRGNGGYNLKPVVTATPIVVSGSISGYVNPTLAAAGAKVYAEQGGKIIKGTVVNADGSFKLLPLIQSSSNGNYEIVVAANGYSSAVIKSVPVLATKNVIVASQTAPIATAVSGSATASGAAVPASDVIEVSGIQTSGGVNYAVNTTNANLDTGAYSVSLSTGAPFVGTYSSTLPVLLTADNAVSGLYSIKAENTTTGVSQQKPVDLTGGNLTNVNFSF